MARLKVNLSQARVCSKKNCGHKGLLHRHHTKHPWMWVNLFVRDLNFRTKKFKKRYRRFVNRYHSFNLKDWEYLCVGHHGEIHEVYDEIIIKNTVKKNYKPLSTYSWAEADALMNSLHKEYVEWKEIPATEANPFTARIKPWRKNDE